MIGSRSSLVVIYQGIDPYYHRRDPDRPNRPTCEPDRGPGVLTNPARAQEAGLIACSDCWSEVTDA